MQIVCSRDIKAAIKNKGFIDYVIPVAMELDLKKAAKTAGKKAISMIKQK